MTQPAILKHMLTAADVTRCRMLRILACQELTVSELCSVLQLPQSTVSRHLKTLLEDDWVASRRDGTSRVYSMVAGGTGAGARGVLGPGGGAAPGGPAGAPGDPGPGGGVGGRGGR